MTTTPGEPVSDEDITTSGITKDGSGGTDGADADGTDGGDADGTDG